MNRRKTNLIKYVWKPHKDMRLKDSQVIEVYKSSLAKK